MHERSPGYQERETPNDACMVNTIVSICSKISGEELVSPTILYDWRGMMLKDIARMYAMHQRKAHEKGLPNKDRDHFTTALHRLDQRTFSKMIGSITSGNGLPLDALRLQTVLQDVEIEYKKGGVLEIAQEISAGRQVAAAYQVENPESEGEKVWHIAHLGIEDDQLISYSDGNIPLSGDDLQGINNAANYLNNTVKTWNLVSVRKFGE